MKRKMTKLFALALSLTMLLGMNMTASAHWRDELPITGQTPNGVNYYGYHSLYSVLDGIPHPQVYVDAIDAAGITNEMSDYDKCVAINNYLCNKLAYRNDSANVELYETLDDFQRLIDKVGVTSPDTFVDTGKHALMHGAAICHGYTDAFSGIAGMLGIEVGDVTSESMNHTWNYVDINGVRYYIDVTWNDTSGNAYLMSTTLWADHQATDLIYN